jgi:photosystem II stability/assembly factor-like uncharacterized protein
MFKGFVFFDLFVESVLTTLRSHMPSAPRTLIYGIFTLISLHDAFSQWQWAGGMPLYDYSSITAAGHCIVVSGLYNGSGTVSSPDAGESWAVTNAGMGTYGLTLVPAGSDTTVLGIWASKILASSDRGRTWSTPAIGLPQGGVGALACGPAAGTQATPTVMGASFSSGMYASTDAGLHWAPANNGFTSSQATCVIAVDSIFIAGTADNGIFRTTDGVMNWVHVTAGLSDTSIGFLAAAGESVFAATGTSVYVSSDRGMSWLLMPRPLPAAVQGLRTFSTPGGGTTGVAVFAVAGNSLFRLAFADSSWTPVMLPGKLFTFPSPGLAVATCDSSLFAVSNSAAWRSTDRGATWERIGGIGSGSEVVQGHVSSRNHQPRLYANMYVSTNFGSSWWSRQTFAVGTNMTALWVSPDTTPLGYDQLIVGSDSGEVETSSDGGRTWQVLRDHDPLMPGYQCLGAAGLDGRVFISLQNNRNFHYATDTIAGIYRTTDDGVYWQKMNTPGLTDSLILNLYILRGKAGGRVLFAGGWFTLFRSTDDGQSWTGITGPPVRSGIKFFRLVNGVLFLCTQGTVRVQYLPDGEIVTTFDSAGVYRSTNDGASWEDVTGELHTTFIRGFAAVAPSIDPTRVYLAASTDTSVYSSTEGGNHWRPFKDGLPRFLVGQPMGADPWYAYLGVNAVQRCSWSDATITGAETGTQGQPMPARLGQNYPNPFNPLTRIEFSIRKASHVELKVYNILGQEVATLVNESLLPGTHMAMFDGGRFASGVYFYRIVAGEFTSVRKMMLLR